MSRRAALRAAMGAAMGTTLWAGLGGWSGGARAAASHAAQPVWASHFERGLADWPGVSSVWGAANQRFVADPEVRGQALQVMLQRGGIDPGSMRRRGLPPSGTGFRARVLGSGTGTGLEAATLRYRLRLAENFDFVRGGKLPGLFGGNGPSGGRIPDGFDGFSLRLMWRRGGAGEVYAYLPTSRVHGSSLAAGLRLQPGRWHELAQEVVLNTPGHSDGWLRLHQDGRVVGEAGGLRFRDGAALRIDGVFVEVFFGGNDDSWASPVDTHVALAEFALFDRVGLLT